MAGEADGGGGGGTGGGVEWVWYRGRYWVRVQQGGKECGVVWRPPGRRRAGTREEGASREGGMLSFLSLQLLWAAVDPTYSCSVRASGAPKASAVGMVGSRRPGMWAEERRGGIDEQERNALHRIPFSHFPGSRCAYGCQNTLTPLQGVGPVCIQSLT